MAYGEEWGTVLEVVEFEGTDAKLRVVRVRGDEVEVQLVDSVEDYIILAGGGTRQEAVQGAVAALEAIVAHLQGPPPIADITRRMLDR